MKRWITSAFAVLLLILLVTPASFAADRAQTHFGLGQLTSWLVDFWSSVQSAMPTLSDEAQKPDGTDQPKAFFEGVGPYIVPVGLTEQLPGDGGPLTEDHADDGGSPSQPAS